MRLLIILAVLALASFAAIFAGRYFGRNMDEHGRTALALLLAPLPQFLFSLHQVLFTPPFGYGRMFNAAGYFWLSYGVILLVGLPMHMLLRKGGYRRLGQYIAVSIFAALVVGFVLTQVSAQISVHPDFEGRSFSERSSMAGGIFALGVIFAVPAAITAASIFWAIAVRPIEGPVPSKATGTSASMGRASHWVALSLAGIVFVGMAAWSFSYADKHASSSRQLQAQMACAREKYAHLPKNQIDQLPTSEHGPIVDLKSLGCSARRQPVPHAMFAYARAPGGHVAFFLRFLGVGLAMSLLLSLCVYAIVRALGLIVGAATSRAIN